MDLLDKLNLFTSIKESRVKGAKIEGVRPVQFMTWWGDFRPGDRVDIMFGEDYINIAGTNAEGNFAGVKKEMEIDNADEMQEFIGSEGRVWNFV